MGHIAQKLLHLSFDELHQAPEAMQIPLFAHIHVLFLQGRVTKVKKFGECSSRLRPQGVATLDGKPCENNNNNK